MIRGRQSYFVAPLYDPLRYLKSATDDTPGSAALVRRRGTLTGIATGTGALVAAGYRYSDHKHVRYSSAGPSRGPRVGPDCAAVTDQSRSLPGLLAAGTRGASVVRLVGTSAAAPQLARWAAQREPPSRTDPLPTPRPATRRQRLVASLRSVFFRTFVCFCVGQAFRVGMDTTL